MFFPEEKITEIVEKNDIVDVISSYLSLSKKGNNYLGLCPFHSEKTPSFTVSPAKQIFYCFGCTAGGNVVSFIQKIERCNFVEALRILADRARVSLPEGNEKDLEKSKATKRLLAMNREAALFFHSNLMKNKGAKEYFERRGLDQSTIKKFGLGYTTDSWNLLGQHLRSKGFTEEELKRSGLVLPRKDGKGYYDRFRNRVMFPIIDTKGNVIAFGGRVLDDSKPKYLNSPDTDVFNKGYHMYALNLVKQVQGLENIIIVEGYMDVISLHQFGIHNVVASLGTAFTEQQAKLLRRFVNEIIIAYDMDIAGQAATIKGMSILEKQGATVKILRVPNGKDPDEYIRKEGKESFLKAVRNSIPLNEYKVELIKQGLDFKNIQDRVKFAQGFSTLLSEMKSSVEIDEYIKKYAKETQIGEQALYAELNNLRNQNNTGNSRHNNEEKIKLPVKKKFTNEDFIERKILSLCVSSENFAKEIFSKIDVEDFTLEENKFLAKIIFQQIKEGKFVSAGELLHHMDTEEEKLFAMDIFNIDTSTFKSEAERPMLVDKLIQNKISKEIQELTKKMNAVFGDDREEANRLFAKITELIKEKGRLEGK